MSRTKVPKICQHCGKEFGALPSEIRRGGGKYCSPECSVRGHIKAKECTCLQCGKIFLQTPARLNKGWGKFCSHACAYKYKSTLQTRECAYCGKKFITQTYKLDSGVGKFCSQKCFGADRTKSGRIKKSCVWCGKEFYPIKHQVELGHAKYCSKKCHNEAGCLSGNPAWKGGISFEPYCHKFNDTIKEEIRDAFGRRCFLCGTPENGRKLHVHHIDYNKTQGCKGQKWALLPMCIGCHTKTGFNRYYYFNLLINYWAMNNEIAITESQTAGFSFTFRC
jgi:hypothetical protein